MIGGGLLKNFGDQNGGKRIACRLVPGQRRWCMVLICEAKTTEIGGQGVRRRNGACCQQKLLSEMCRQETCIFVSKYLEEGLDGRAFPTIVCF
jgi:hypothetical protein